MKNRRSKNEVIMDDILESMVPGRWVYEQELVGTDGTVRYPDFTIETTTGRRIVWQHLGMLDDPQYAANWKAKKQWYRVNGMLPWPDGGGPEGTLVWTDDRGGGDVPCLATARTASVRWTVEGKSSNQKDPGHEGAAQEAARIVKHQACPRSLSERGLLLAVPAW